MLYCWDRRPANNRGSIRVKVIVEGLSVPVKQVKSVKVSQRMSLPAELQKALGGDALFVDWNRKTWATDIRNGFDIREVAQGYRLTCNFTGGYQHKLILFPKEEVHTKRMFVSFVLADGRCGFSFRPRSLRAGATGVSPDFVPGKRYDVELWLEGGVAKALVNGRPIAIPHEPDKYGYFAIELGLFTKH